MAAHEYAFTLTPGNSSKTRSFAIACAAIAAICVLSSTVVMRELMGAPTARAAVTTTARSWALEPRWWPGEIKQILRPASTVPDNDLTFVKGYEQLLLRPASTVPDSDLTFAKDYQQLLLRPASTVPDSDLTFAKGYQLRLAARKATQPAAEPPSAAAQIAAGPTARKATTVVNSEAPTVRRVSTTPVEPGTDPFARFDTGTRALAYDEQRPSVRGFAYRSAPSRGLFGTLY